MADITVTFALAKLGNILYPGAENTGRLEIIDISIPEQVVDTLRIDTNYLTFEEAKKMLPKRKSRSNKGTFGKLLIVAGSEKMPGAAFLAGKSAYRAGVGLVYSAIVYHRRKVMQSLLPEAVCLSVDDYDGCVYRESFDGIDESLLNMTAVAVGPGLGDGKYVKDFVERLLKEATVTVVLDADALNAISKIPDVLRKTAKIPIITPHPGEMSRLTGLSVKEILDDPIECARNFALNYKTITVLKDARTIIASPDGRVYINLTGNNAMAKGGSGDVLTGIISAFVAEGMDSFDAAVLGVYVHAMAGDMAAKDLGHFGVLARDLTEYTAKVLKKLEE